MRMRSLVTVSVLCLCLVLGTGCTITLGESPGQTDAAAAGSSLAQASDVLEGIDADSRVVALSRSIGELWLLAGGQLAGVTEDGRDLMGITDDVESIGSVSRPSLERVMALEPDLVMLSDELPSHKELHTGLDEAGVPALVVDINSFDDYATIMEALTACTGREDLYEAHVTTVRTQVEQVIEHGTRREGTYLALSVASDSVAMLGNDSFACAMMDDLGLSNAAGTQQASDELSLKTIADPDPDWIFVIYQGDEAKAQKALEEGFSSSPAWSRLSAVQAGHVVVLPQALFAYAPNAKWGEAYAYLSQTLHGALA